MGQSGKNPALKERAPWVALKRMPNVLIRGCQLLKESSTFGTAVQMLKQGLKALFIAAGTLGIHL